KAVVDADAHLRRDLDGSGGQRGGGEELGWGGHHVGPERESLARGETTLALGPGEGVGQLGGEDVGSPQCVDGLLEIVPQPQGLIRVCLSDYPFERYAGIKDVVHSSVPSRSSRMAGTPMLRTPCLARTSRRMRSARSRTRRTTSGGTGWPAATRSATRRASRITSGGMPALVVSV